MISPGDAVLAECHAIEGAVAGLDDAAWMQETNCPPWTLKELIVHTWQTLLLPRSFSEAEATSVAAADWYRRTERETDDYRARNVGRARDAGAQFSDGPAAVQALVEAGAAIHRRLAATDGELIVAHPAVGAIRLNDFMVTRVISVAVHGFDVAITIGTNPFITPAGLDITCRVLEQLLGVEAADLGWSQLELALWGTGRQPVPDARAPREIRDRLPLIS